MDDRPERRRIHDRIRDLEAAPLRELLAECWRRQGYTATIVDEAIFATDANHETVEIHLLDPEEDDLEAVLETTRAEEVVLVTPTADAKGITPTRPAVRLLNGRDLADLIVDLGAHDLLEEDVGNVGSPGLPTPRTWLLVTVATIGWFLSVLTLSVGPAFFPSYTQELTVGGGIGAFVCWTLLPATIFFDATRIDGLEVAYRPSRLLWAGLAFFGAGLASSYYIWKRLEYGLGGGVTRGVSGDRS